MADPRIVADDWKQESCRQDRENDRAITTVAMLNKVSFSPIAH